MGILKGILYLTIFVFMLWIVISTYPTWRLFAPEYLIFVIFATIGAFAGMLVVTLYAFKS